MCVISTNTRNASAHYGMDGIVGCQSLMSATGSPVFGTLNRIPLGRAWSPPQAITGGLVTRRTPSESGQSGSHLMPSINHLVEMTKSVKKRTEHFVDNRSNPTTHC